MPSHGEVTVHAVIAQVAHQRTEAVDVKLKNQRETDQDGVMRLGRFEDLRWVLPDVEYLDLITMQPEGGCEVTRDPDFPGFETRPT